MAVLIKYADYQKAYFIAHIYAPVHYDWLCLFFHEETISFLSARVVLICTLRKSNKRERNQTFARLLWGRCQSKKTKVAVTRLSPDFRQTTARLVPDICQTAARLPPDWCQTGARLFFLHGFLDNFFYIHFSLFEKKNNFFLIFESHFLRERLIYRLKSLTTYNTHWRLYLVNILRDYLHELKKKKKIYKNSSVFVVSW